VQVTDTVVLPVTAVVRSDVPGVEGNVNVAPLIVHDAVIWTPTFKLAVAFPACAMGAAHSHHRSGATTALVQRIEPQFATTRFFARRNNRCT